MRAHARVVVVGLAGGALLAGALVVPAAEATAAPKLALPGDFNGDGKRDLAIGVFHRDVGSAHNAGEVIVRLRGQKGASATINQDSVGAPGTAGDGHSFGAVLASGDFDRDGFADLAIGSPRDPVGTRAGAGSVTVFYGSAGGLLEDRAQRITQAGKRVPGVARAGDGFGAALAAADINEDGFDDLVVGAPAEKVGTKARAGSVTTFLGQKFGLRKGSGRRFTQATPGVAGKLEAGAAFGASFGVDDFNHDGGVEFAVGIPGANTPGHAGTGALLVTVDGIRGPKLGASRLLTATGAKALGTSLATGDIDSDGYADLAAGAPSSVVKGHKRAGAVVVFSGAAAGAGLRSSRATQIDESLSADGVSISGGDRLGFSVSMGDVTGDGFDDLAVGVPGRTVHHHADAGAALLFRGTASGVKTDGHVTVVDIATPAKQDLLGTTVVIADVIGDKHGDLMAWVPGEDLGPSSTNCGSVQVLPGNNTGVNPNAGQELQQKALKAGAPETGDGFGRGLLP